MNRAKNFLQPTVKNTKSFILPQTIKKMQHTRLKISANCFIRDCKKGSIRD